MPAPLLTPCRWPGGCAALVRAGYCAAHRALAAPDRPTPSAQGYDALWRRFRRLVAKRLLTLGQPVACGASLPNGPLMVDSACARAGLLVTTRLHLDHEPPLRPDERDDPHAICDPLRVGFLCHSCHSRKSLRQRAAGPVLPGRLGAPVPGPRLRVRVRPAAEAR